MRIKRIAVLSLLLVVALFTLEFAQTQPTSAANAGVVRRDIPAGAPLDRAIHNAPLGSWQTAYANTCHVDFQLGNYGGAGFGRLRASYSTCVAAGIHITVLAGAGLSGIPANTTCTWSSDPNAPVTGCALLLPSTDIWVQYSGPNSIVQVTVWGCTSSGPTGCEYTTADPFP